MKLDRIGLECVENKFLKLPNIKKYEVVHRTEDGFIASVEMDDGYDFQINAYFMNRVFPSTVIRLIEKQKKARKLTFWLLHIFQRELHKYVKITKWVILTMQEIVGLWVILFICLKKKIRIQGPKSKALCPYLKGLPWCIPVFYASCLWM